MIATDVRRILNEVSHLLGFVHLTKEPEPVTGGLLHRIWRVDMGNRTFAMKILNPEIMSRRNAIQNYRNSEIVASTALAHGLRSVPALRFGDDPWVELNGQYVMVFDWVEGQKMLPTTCTTEHASRIGNVLFQLHDMNMTIDGMTQPSLSVIAEETWDAHFARARQDSLRWGYFDDALLDDILSWSRMYQEAAGDLSNNLVVSHRDLDAKNVIWDKENVPYLIDWESAGYINPSTEVIEAALNWSRDINGAPDKELFQGVIRSYVSAGGKLHADAQTLLYGTFGGMLGWLEYNMRRSMDPVAFGADERTLGDKEVHNTIRSLRQLNAAVSVYAGWIEEALR